MLYPRHQEEEHRNLPTKKPSSPVLSSFGEGLNYYEQSLSDFSPQIFYVFLIEYFQNNWKELLDLMWLGVLVIFNQRFCRYGMSSADGVQS